MPSPRLLLEQLFSLGLLGVLQQLLLSAAGALSRSQCKRSEDGEYPPQVPAADNGGEAPIASGGAEAPDGWEAFEPGVLLAVLALVIQVAGMPGGPESLESSQQEADEQLDGGSGGDGASISGTLLRLLALLANGDDEGEGRLRESLVIAAVLLPRMAASLRAAPPLVLAAARTLVECDPGDLDAQDACWYLLASVAKEAASRKLRSAAEAPAREGPPGVGAEGPGRDGWDGHMRRVAELLPRCRVPDSSRRYADSADRWMRAYFIGDADG